MKFVGMLLNLSAVFGRLGLEVEVVFSFLLGGITWVWVLFYMALWYYDNLGLEFLYL